MELVRATSENEHCINVTLEIFSERYASQRFNFSSEDHPDSLGILKYFGGVIKSSKFHFAHKDDCDPDTTSKYRQLLQYANEYYQSVKDFEVMGGICGINLFDEIYNGFYKIENVFIHQRDFLRYRHSSCGLFSKVRNLQLNLGSLNVQSFIDCEFDLLDELTIGGAILNETFDETFKSFLIKNSRIQHISFTSPTRRRTFELLKKYARNLKHVGIFDKVLDDDVENEIFLPRVRKLEISFTNGSACEPPMGITFGGDELQELSLNCDFIDKNYKYFSTLYRYPNVKSLTLGKQYGIKRIVGKFPQLIEANFTNLYADVDDIVKFMKKCDHLKKVNFVFADSNSNLAERTFGELGLSWRLGIKSLERDPHSYLQFEWNKPNSANSKCVTSGLLSLVIIMQICRTVFN